MNSYTFNNQPLNAKMADSPGDSKPQADDMPCGTHNLEGHTQWNCDKCLERLDRDSDELVRSGMLTYHFCTEKQFDALGSLHQFDKTPWVDLMPDPNQPRKVQNRAWAWNCVKELQARKDAARELHEIMIAQHYEQNEGKTNLTASAADGMCNDSNDNELHPQWTCHYCLARLDSQWDKLLREAMLSQGWTEVQINNAGSLRQFDTKPWSKMVPDPNQSQLIRVRAWELARLKELEARMEKAGNVHKARSGDDEAIDEAKTDMGM